jgi:hypothetical protein
MTDDPKDELGETDEEEDERQPKRIGPPEDFDFPMVLPQSLTDLLNPERKLVPPIDDEDDEAPQSTSPRLPNRDVEPHGS